MIKSIENFPLKNATQITFTKEMSPEEADYKYLSLVQSTDMNLNPQELRVFGVVYGKQTQEPGRNHALYSPNSFNTIIELKNKILHNVKKQDNLDFSNGLIKGNIIKNDANWESLVNAYTISKKNEVWSTLLQQAFSETIAMEKATLFIDNNSDNNDPELLQLFNIIENFTESDILKKEKIIKDSVSSYLQEDKESFKNNIILLQK